MSTVFISYSRKDKGFVQGLHEALQARGLDTWVDWQSIPPTADWLQEVHAGIEAGDTFVFVISPDSVASDVCNQELDHAVTYNKRIVPVVCRDVDFRTVRPELGHINCLFLRPVDDFDAAFARLIDAINIDLAWVQTHTRLLLRAREWESRRRDRSYLLRGTDLGAAERWLGYAGIGKEPAPTALHTQYILAGRKVENRRQRATTGAVVVGMVLASLLAIVAALNGHEAAA